VKDWFRKNRWLGTFVAASGMLGLIALILLWLARSSYEADFAQFNEAAAEQHRLEQLDPFPNEDNEKKMQDLLGSYTAALDAFQNKIKAYASPEPALAPNEFQTRLRQALALTTGKARVNKVKLPEKFFLGFDDFTAALPDTAAAPLLGQELSQIQLLMNMLIDAKVDGINEFHRSPLPEEHDVIAAAARQGSKETAAKVLRGIVELTFTAAPAAARKVLNKIASNDSQFFTIRTLHVRNQQVKGPPRQGEGGAPGTQLTSAKQPGAVSFIVGNEHIEVSARIEIVRFVFEKT
jgi:DNA-binding GntR family transcriptional regulator